MQRVKAHELRSKDESALVAELTKQRKDLAALRVSKVSSQPQVKLSKIRVSIKKIVNMLHLALRYSSYNLCIVCEKGNC